MLIHEMCFLITHHPKGGDLEAIFSKIIFMLFIFACLILLLIQQATYCTFRTLLNLGCIVSSLIATLLNFVLLYHYSKIMVHILSCIVSACTCLYHCFLVLYVASYIVLPAYPGSIYYGTNTSSNCWEISL
jgi:predicted ferric reductase